MPLRLYIITGSGINNCYLEIKFKVWQEHLDTRTLNFFEVRRDGSFRQNMYDPGRDRTCNLLIRSQTRYPCATGPLFHYTGVWRSITYYTKLYKKLEKWQHSMFTKKLRLLLSVKIPFLCSKSLNTCLCEKTTLDPHLYSKFFVWSMIN